MTDEELNKLRLRAKNARDPNDHWVVREYRAALRAASEEQRAAMAARSDVEAGAAYRAAPEYWHRYAMRLAPWSKARQDILRHLAAT